MEVFMKEMNAQQTQLIQDYLNSEMKDFKNFLVESFSENIQPTPLKTVEQSKREIENEINNSLALFMQDISLGFSLFKEKVQGAEEKQWWGEFLNRISSIACSASGATTEPPQVIPYSDFEMMVNIAKREVKENRGVEASAMFRFILQMDPTYTDAWIGLAISEEAQGNMVQAGKIYDLGMEMLPFDFLLHFYAAQFFLLTNQKEKGREILSWCVEEMRKVGMSDSTVFDEMNKLLKME